MAVSERGSLSYGMQARHETAMRREDADERDAEAERVMRTIFRRCLSCPDETPTCPPCTNGQICSLVPSDCNTCAHNICIDNPSPPAPASSGPNVGAIAGGVVGGVVFVGLLVFLVWRFYIRKRRAQQDAQAEWDEDDIAQQKAAFQSMQHDAASTRTRGSLANSFLSRASNIIQIAYIPGVTNRNGSSHNSMLGASPVPPIPAARGTPRSPLSNKDDALFFRPSDIRDSRLSAASSAADRRDTQYTRSSLAPSLARSSMASGVYHDDATIEPMPATQISRVMPRMVSVKPSTSSGSPTENSDAPSPASGPAYIDFGATTPGGKAAPVQVFMPGQGESSSTGGSLRGKGAFGKAQQITVGGKTKGRFPVRSVSNESASGSTPGRHAPQVSSPLVATSADTGDDDDIKDDEHARARRSFYQTPTRETSSPVPSSPMESPFFDAVETPAPAATASSRPNPSSSTASSAGSTDIGAPARRGANGMGGLSAVIEEATKRASTPPSHAGLGGKRQPSPFSDDHRID